MTLINCKHMNDRQCDHPKAPLGKRPHPQKCLRFCTVYDGPERPAFVGVGVPVSSVGCSPCAAAAKARVKPVKPDPAEAMRILNEAMNAGE